MKITFIEPRYFSTWENLGVGYIITYLKKHWHGDLEIEFFQGYYDNDDEILVGCKKSDIVAFSCVSSTYKHAVDLATQIAFLNPYARFVFGGYHPSARPEMVSEELKKHLPIPENIYVVEGEGEEPFLEIVRGTSQWRLKGLVEDLDKLPFPDREAIKVERNIATAYQDNKETITSIQSCRVCPFRCLMCANYVIHGFGPVRERSSKLILDEVEEIISKYRIDFLKFRDATFNTRIEKVLAFCKEKVQRKVDIPWGCNVHPAIVNREMLHAMKEANCREIWVGCESGSPEVLKAIRKGVTPPQIVKVFDWAKEEGLKRRAYFMVGMPNEREGDIKMTEALAERIDADFYGFTIVCPYPGTGLYHNSKHSAVDWSLCNEYSNPVWSTKHFTNEELHKIQKGLTKKFEDRLVWRHRIKVEDEKKA